MQSLNNLISQISHIIGNPDSVPMKRLIRELIISTRVSLIAKSYNNRRYIDKSMTQKIVLSLIDVRASDFQPVNAFKDRPIKRTAIKVPKAIRFDNGIPFTSVRTNGVENPYEIPFVRQSVSKFYKNNPIGKCGIMYDYINGYIYLNNLHNPNFDSIESIVIEAVFNEPNLIIIGNSVDGFSYGIDDNEDFPIPSDLIDSLIDIVVNKIRNKEFDDNTINKEVLTKS